MGPAKYFKAVFFNGWNQLALWGGLGFALLSGAPFVTVPIVLAAELAFLALLGTHPKFQASVDAQEAARLRKASSKTAAQSLKEIQKVLPKESWDRFEQLRRRCLELRQIATDLKQSNAADSGAPLESFQLAGLDKLLWIFLRLLFTQFSIARFLERTSLKQIQQDIAQTKARLAEVPKITRNTEKIRATLEDNLKTCLDRLANYEKARDNYDLVGLEIERLENKIRTLAELAVNRQEPDFISGQVDQVATSMLETEKTMTDLQFATGLGAFEEEAPELLQEKEIHYIR